MIETCKSKMSVYLIALIDFFPSCGWDGGVWAFESVSKRFHREVKDFGSAIVREQQ
jgi:hypothetical protein